VLLDETASLPPYDQPLTMNPNLTPKWPPFREDLLSFCKAKRGREAALVRHLGVPQPTVSAWLHGRQEPGAEATLQLREWLVEETRREAFDRSTTKLNREPSPDRERDEERTPAV
jgi:transcriptional regulator with XRE-family HTH domain